MPSNAHRPLWVHPVAAALVLALGGHSVAQPAAPEVYSKAPEMTEDVGTPAGTGAQSAGDAPPASPNAVNGYVDSRSQLTRAKVFGVIPTGDLAQLDELLEANLQLRHHYGEHGFVYADVSGFARAAGNFRSLGPDGQEQVASAHDVSAYRPLFSLNELYLSQELGASLNLLLGKKRVVWGAGFGFNPTDLVNPPKDPTDPNFQRAGAYMARLEANLGKVAFTLLASPAVLEQANGIPYGFLTYPSYDQKDRQEHYLLAARAYALVADADVNLMLFFSNRYNDAFERKLRVGASFSRYFFTDYELHVEALVQQGSTRRYPNPACAPDALQAFLCARFATPLLEQRKLDDSTLYPRVLVGTRRQFNDESLLSVEYYFQADGYTQAEFQGYVDQLELAKRERQLTAGLAPSGGGGEAGIPQKFAFEPVGRHYLFLNYSKPKLFDDWTVGAVLIANLSDLSSVLTPSVSWSATEWMTLTLSGFLPLSGPRSLAATTNAGGSFGEYTLTPFSYRALFEARVFY